MHARNGGRKTSRSVRSEASNGAPLIPLTGCEPPTKCLAQAMTRSVPVKSAPLITAGQMRRPFCRPAAGLRRTTPPQRPQRASRATSTLGLKVLGAHGPHFERRFTAEAFHQCGIERRGLSDRGRINRRTAIKAVAVDGVDTDQKRNLQAAFLRQALQVMASSGLRHGKTSWPRPPRPSAECRSSGSLGNILGRARRESPRAWRSAQPCAGVPVPRIGTSARSFHAGSCGPSSRRYAVRQVAKNIFVERLRTVGTACTPQNGHRQQRPSEQSSFHSFEKS